jgi:hypothetical protein
LSFFLFSCKNGELDISPPLVEHKPHKKKHKKKEKKAAKNQEAEEADLLGLEPDQPLAANISILASDENIQVKIFISADLTRLEIMEPYHDLY